MAQVKLSPEAFRELERLPSPVRRRVESLVGRLVDWPAVSGSRPLRGWLRGRYRLRTGDYRVQFRVDGNEVIVEKIGHREGFYEA